MTPPEPPASTKTDWLLIGLLLLLVVPLRLWLLHNTEVTARDSIGYIRYALQFEQMPWQEVLLKNHQHPGYPVCVRLASLPLRWHDGQTTPENMELATQLVNLAASLFLILPMYWLGRQFFDRQVSFGAVLLHQYLPISAQHLSDGISEPLFLLLLVSALLQGVHAVRDHRLWRCALAGTFAGLAYLTRPEGALVLPAFAAILFVSQFRAEWRCSWRWFFACGLGTILCAMLLGSIYVAATGNITKKLSVLAIFANIREILKTFLGSSSSAAASSELQIFAASFPWIDHKGLRLARSVWALLTELNQGFHYLATIPALVGCWWTFVSLRRHPGYWFLVVYAVMHSTVLVALGMSVAYVSDRHVMILILLGCFLVVFGLQQLAQRIAAWRNKAAETALPRAATAWLAALMLALIGFGVPKATQRLHGNRVGNHAAGLWLAHHLQGGDVVEDDHAWSHYFAGLVFQERFTPVFPASLQANCYVVITRSRDSQVDAKRQNVLAGDARVRFVWPEQSDLASARVVVYCQQRTYERNPWTTPSAP